MNNTSLLKQYYWELITRDGEIIEIPPNAVDSVNRAIANGNPIMTKYSGSIPSQGVRFRPTDKLYVDTKLLEEASQAFKSPIMTEDGIKSRWVKKQVTRAKWEKYYSPHHAYRRLSDENNMVMIAFKLPVHQIDLTLQTYCDQHEVEKLEK